MKILTWMQSKLGSKQETKTSNSKNFDHPIQVQSLSPKDEFSDWPQGLLAIGTFGIKNSTPTFKEDENFSKINESVEKDLNFFAESTSGEEEVKEKEEDEDEEYEYFDYSLEENSRIKTLQQSNSLKEKNIGKKSLSFLFKKMFLFRSGFSSTPTFKDSFPDTNLDKSRMEKILRAILNKKMYTQNTTPKPSYTTTKKKMYLQNNDNISICESDEDTDNANEGSKWVKTDSEYIVLEI